MSEFFVALALPDLDWVKMWEFFIPAALAFVFGAILQWRLMERQEKFLTKLENDRAASDEKAEARRLNAEAVNASRQIEAQKKIAMEGRNLLRQEGSRNRSEQRRNKG